MRAIETCPLQWSLGRATYPGIWARTGYPDRVYTGTVVGQVVHQAIERMTKAVGLAATKTDVSGLVGLVKVLGGYSAILDAESESVAAKLAANPRVATGDRDIREELRQRLPGMRLQLQLFARSALARTSEPRPGARTPAESTETRAIHHGLNAEVELGDSAGLWRGTADLIRADNHGVEIIDFKTGVAKEEHALQLRLYALLFLADRLVNPGDLPVTKLTLIYGDREIDVAVPSGTDRLALQSEVDARAMQAQQDVAMKPPEARPSPEACGFCAVRQLCPTYWSPAGQALAGMSATRDGLVDAEICLHERTAEATWRGSVATCGALADGVEVLVRCPKDKETLTSVLGRLGRGRILSVQLIQPTEDTAQLPVLNLTRVSEAFAIREGE